MNEITADGIAVLIPPDSSRRKDARPGWNGGAYAFMRPVLATEQSAELYKQRRQLIEPIFANTNTTVASPASHVEERAAARTGWRLMATAHNVQKLQGKAP